MLCPSKVSVYTAFDWIIKHVEVFHDTNDTTFQLLLVNILNQNITMKYFIIKFLAHWFEDIRGCTQIE